MLARGGRPPGLPPLALSLVSGWSPWAWWVVARRLVAWWVVAWWLVAGRGVAWRLAVGLLPA